jgi:broad specificity phosphatase PhoE
MALHSLFLARHGETEWSVTLQHTGRTDIPLTPRGEADALLLGSRLKPIPFTRVLTSPLQRARRTAEIAGFTPEDEPALLEWHYGDYEGLRSVEIRQRRPGWDLFRDGCPGGEAPTAVAGRADDLLRRLQSVDGSVLLFAHGHILRVLGARFIGLDVTAAKRLYLGTASVSILGYEHPPEDPVVRLWNDRLHVEA